jgi:hypothetical protein
MDMQNKQQSAEEGGGICCKFDCCLVSISFYRNNSYFKSKLHQQLDYYVRYYIVILIQWLIVVLCLEFIDHSIDRFNSIVS